MNGDEVKYVQRPPLIRPHLTHNTLLGEMRKMANSQPVSPTPSSPPSPKSTSESPTRSIKRSSSTSNDLLYERDRFRARHQNLNAECEVCNGVTLKTTKLNISEDALDGDIEEEGELSDDSAEKAAEGDDSEAVHTSGDTTEEIILGDETPESEISQQPHLEKFHLESSQLEHLDLVLEVSESMRLVVEPVSKVNIPLIAAKSANAKNEKSAIAATAKGNNTRSTETMDPVRTNEVRCEVLGNDALNKVRCDAFAGEGFGMKESPFITNKPINKLVEPIYLKSKKTTDFTAFEPPTSDVTSSIKDLSPLDPKSPQFKFGPERCKTISQSDLSSAFQWYFSTLLPSTKVMFPWLHGLNEENFAQRLFFLFQNSVQNIVRKPEGVRFLMCVSTNETDDDPAFHLLKNTVGITEILLKIDVTRTQVYETLDEIFDKVFGEDLEMDIGFIETLKDDCLKTNFFPIFLNLDPKNGISLRNFHIQVCKLALCSDFVVYPLEGDVEDAQRFARILWLAQRYEATLQKSQTQYNVFVLDGYECVPREMVKLDAMSVYENYHNERNTLYEDWSEDITEKIEQHQEAGSHEKTIQEKLVDMYAPSTTDIALDIALVLDYQLKEKIETCRMSTATKISLNVWTGNLWDYQIMMCFLSENDLSYQDTMGIPKGSTLQLVAMTPQESINDSFLFSESYSLNSVRLPKFNMANSDSLDSLSSVNSPDSLNENQLGFDSTPRIDSSNSSTSPPSESQGLPMPKANWRLFINCRNGATFPSNATLRDLLFKYSISSHTVDIDADEHKVLEFPPSGSIGIGDCQKENLMSILNTCKLIYLFSASSSSDAQATLIHCSDGYTELSLLTLCFLIYANDFSLQKSILNLHNTHGRPFYIFNSDVLILQKLEPMLRRFSPKRAGQVEWGKFEVLLDSEISELLLGRSTSNKMHRSLKLGYIANDSDSSEEEEVIPTADDWVSEVEGSLPSRILPYLYLGSLVHANSLPLLRDLGITHVISVGEQLDWLSGGNFKKNNITKVEKATDGGIEKFTLQDCSVQRVMKVNNLQDDGIDELSKSLPRILEYIENEHRNGKILVHCRVGVSRSATVVIAEVMRRLQLSLPDAYLYVRVRRLNIIIQPNLRFMYELFKWDEVEKQAKRGKKVALRDIDWFMMCREIMKLNIPYLR